jgi:spermidine/putrescine transport system permease protein
MGFMPPLVPILILGLAMLFFLAQVDLSGGLHSVIIAHTVLCIPFATAVIRLRLSQMDASLGAASWNLGATQWQAMRHVIVPFCLPAIFAALFVTAAVSFDEFAIAWFVSGLQETLPVRVLNFVQGQASPRIKAIGSFTFTISIVLVVIAQFLLLRDGSGRKSGKEQG